MRMGPIKVAEIFVGGMGLQRDAQAPAPVLDVVGADVQLAVAEVVDPGDLAVQGAALLAAGFTEVASNG